MQKEYWKDFFLNPKRIKKRPSYPRLFAAGCWAGLVQCLVCTPVELVKCKLQNQKDGKPLYTGTWDCLRKMVQANGLRIGLFRGWWSTVWRDFPSFGFYFVTYEYCKYEFTPFLPDGTKASPTRSMMLFSGAMAGVATWLSTYPFDVLKSTIQTLPDDTPSEKTKMWFVGKKYYNEYGIRYFFRGLTPALIRAAPVNAVTFLIYEESLNGINYLENRLNKRVI